MSKENILFGRLGNKTTDIKHFIQYLPLDIKNVIEPFGGTFAVTRIIYNDNKYNKFVNDNDEQLVEIYKNPEAYSTLCKHLNTIAKKHVNENNNVIVKKFLEETEKDKLCIENKNVYEYWKKEKIIRGGIVKIIKEINHTKMIDTMKNIKFTFEDYKIILDRYKYTKDSFIFLDPPYLFSDNSQYARQSKTQDTDMTDMIYIILDMLKDKKTKAKIMMIINDLKLLRYLFKDYIKGDYTRVYQTAKRKCQHLIITNY